MGSPTLKKKSELNYRHGSTAHSCSECNAYVPDFDVRATFQDGEHLRFESRCRVMGLKAGRAYRINPKNICDAHNNSDMSKH